MSRTELFQWTDEPLDLIQSRLAQALAEQGDRAPLRFLAPDPDRGSGLYAGQFWEHQGQRFRHRSYRNWVDLAEILHCRLLTPKAAKAPWVELGFEPLRATKANKAPQGAVQERYGEQSEFFAIQKLEEPCFLDDLRRAYARVNAPARRRVLDLGVHRGDELVPLLPHWSGPDCQDHELVGVDHCPSAIQAAKARFQDPRLAFVCDDIKNYQNWQGPAFDLIVSIGTLQCRELQGQAIFPPLLRQHLAKDGAVILGFPYLRYVDGEIRQGGQMRNYSEAEHALVFKDLLYYRKLLQRRATQVTITGRYYLFLTAWSSSRRTM